MNLNEPPAEVSSQQIKERLQALQAHFPTDRDITLVVASKYATAEQVRTGYAAGLRHFGENRVQDALTKQAALANTLGDDAHWHFIGHLQKNKINKVIGRFELIHSIDSLELAEALSNKTMAQPVANKALAHLDQLQEHKPQKILLQVNTSGETSKQGISPEHCRQQFEQFLALPGIEICGLMTMAPLEASEVQKHGVFSGLATLRDQLRREFATPLPELSMGMSQDYIPALACGATILRIGRYFF